MSEVVVVAGALVVLIVGVYLMMRWQGALGGVAVAIAGMLVGLALFPRTLGTLVPSDGTRGDIAPPEISFTVYGTAVVLSTLIVVVSLRRLTIPLPHVLFVLVLTVSMFTSWQGSVAQWSGYLLLVGAVLAFAVGREVGAEVFAKPDLAAFFVRVLLAITLVQFVIAAIQATGAISLPTWLLGTGRTLGETGGRVFGLANHPANLSKVMFAMTALALPFTISGERGTRKMAWWIVILATVVTGLTVSRANIVASAILLVLWFVTFPGRARVGTRVAATVGLGVAGLVFAPAVLSRFDEDEAGGLRPLLLQAGLDQLARDLWVGTGPSSYIEVVQRFDSATASGYPVHNAVLLLTAEVGLVGAVLFLLPLLIAVLGAVRRIRRASEWAYTPRVLLFVSPGVAVIAGTGWGVLSGQILLLTMFMLGVLAYFQVRSAQPQPLVLSEQIADLGTPERSRA